jgi:hypothetical protein
MADGELVIDEKSFYQNRCKEIGIGMTLNSYEIISKLTPIEKRKKIFNIACQLAKLQLANSLKSSHVNAVISNLEIREMKDQSIQTEELVLNVNHYPSWVTCHDAKIFILKSYKDRQCETLNNSMEDLETRILILEERLKHIYLPV